jgi:hypothetical protein
VELQAVLPGRGLPQHQERQPRHQRFNQLLKKQVVAVFL